MARRRSLSSSIPALLVIIVGIIVVLTVWRNKNFLRFGSVTAGAAMGATVQGPNIYTNLGDIPRSGGSGLSWANSDTSHRDNVSFPCTECARETTWIFTPGTGGGGGSTGEDVTVKMGSHGDSSDQTALIGFGSIPYSGGGGEWKSEGPHGNDAGVSGSAEGSVELTGDSPMGIKGISWPIDNNGTQHHEIWTNPAGTLEGTWTLAAVFEGTTSGSNPLTCPIPPDGSGNCQDTLRLDGATPTGHELTARYMIKIDPGDGTPVGGGTAPTLIPTQDRGEGDEEISPAEEEPEEEEEEEEEDTEEDEDEDGDEPGGDFTGRSTGPGTRSQDETTRRINSCSGLTGETYRGCVNGSAAQSNRRRAPLARAMFSAYSFPYLRRSRIRIGNL